MKNVEDLTESAAELTDQGLSKGEIADELNVSRETASWLVERSGVDRGDATGGRGSGSAGEPGGDQTTTEDIHVDWSAIGQRSVRLESVGRALGDLLSEGHGDATLTVGIEKAGAPLATVVANQLETSLATYAPSKHQWEEGDLGEGGTFSRNFADVDGRSCYVVDDIITSGTTMRETVAAIKESGGDPVACAVLADKQGIDAVDGVPVGSLLQVIRVGER